MVRPHDAALPIAVCCFALMCHAQDPSALAPPRNGPRAIDVGWHVLTGLTVHSAPGTSPVIGSIEIRDGRVVGIHPADVPPAAGARVWPRQGRHVYAAFIDPFVEVDAPAVDRNRPGAHWSAKVAPDRRALDGQGLDAAARAALRKQGFGAVAIAPKGGIFRGRGALVSLSEAPGDGPPAAAPLPYRADVYGVVGFDTGGFARTEGPPRDPTAEETARWERYPNSLMGAIALIRQTLSDADWAANSPPGSANVLRTLARPDAPPLLFDAVDELDILRAAKIAREFERRAIVVGSGFEFRRIPAIAAQKLPLVIPFANPERPRVGSVGEAEAVDLKDLMAWEQAPTNLKRLDDAGVQVALTTAKLRDGAAFLENVRDAVRHGLHEDRALAMLTTEPARILSADGLGVIAKGAIANLVLSDGPMFAKETKIVEVWVDGRVHEVTPPSGHARGEWSVTMDPAPIAAVSLSIGRDDRVRVQAGGAGRRAREASVTEDRITFVTDADVALVSGLSTWTGIVAQDAMTGSGVFANGATFRWSARRTAATESRASDDDGADSRPQTRPERKDPAPVAITPLPTPFGPYGLDASPPQQDTVIFTGATVWTCGAAGVIEGGHVLVERGRIVSVGPGTPAIPAGSLVVDAANRHITPGLIDCHSHTGIARGTNESGQAVTAEVRIQDVTDPDSIHWYRELAGGLTTVNVLHGSSNAIGGQNCVIKLRWGESHPDAMHFEGAPGGIKFALGENPKQSNAGDRSTTRYPQTRMGVEALIRDRFIAAREYAARRRDGSARRDLELDALAEILAGTRLVHCHSYRQDEILMLCRVAKEFGFRIGTFQHVLEGYKVADAIKESAIGASAFSDWWAYKVEVQDAIPQNGPIMHDVGVVVSYNSDSDELARRMNVEAAKAVKYGGLSKSRALEFVTKNPATQLGIDKRVGSLEPGKDADIVVWSGDPLSTRSRCEQTWIDGRRYFSIESDAAARAKAASERTRLIQKVLEAGRGGRGGDEPSAGDGRSDDAPSRRRGRPGALHDRGSEDFMLPGDCGCGHEEDDR